MHYNPWCFDGHWCVDFNSKGVFDIIINFHPQLVIKFEYLHQ